MVEIKFKGEEELSILHEECVKLGCEVEIIQYVQMALSKGLTGQRYNDALALYADLMKKHVEAKVNALMRITGIKYYQEEAMP